MIKEKEEKNRLHLSYKIDAIYTDIDILYEITPRYEDEEWWINNRIKYLNSKARHFIMVLKKQYGCNYKRFMLQPMGTLQEYH